MAESYYMLPKDYIEYISPTEFVPEIQVLCIEDDHIHRIEKPSW